MAKAESTETYVDVLQQIDALQTKAAKLREKEVADVIAKIKEAMRVYGLTGYDLGIRGSSAPKTVKSPLPAKYRDQSGNTWSGKGKRPRWLVDAIAAGKTLEDFTIKQ
jgi:DNA-binding protein H-NS